jgi:mRNA interferase MazF
MRRMLQPSTTYNPGDVAIVRFQFRQEPHPKPRPVVVVSVSDFQASRRDVVVIAISSRTDRTYFGDCVLEDWDEAGLTEACKVKGIFRTIEQSKIRDVIGHLSPADSARVSESMRAILGL